MGYSLGGKVKTSAVNNAKTSHAVWWGWWDGSDLIL